MRQTATGAADWRHARAAGMLYLAIIVLGIGAEAGLRAPLIDWQSGAATATALTEGMGRFRLSILFDLAMAASDVALAVLLYAMLRAVAPVLALMAMVFRLMQAAVIAGNAMALRAAGEVAMAGGDPLPHLAEHAAGYDLGLFFFAFNSLMMAVLLIRAGAPRVIGWGIGAAGLVYLGGSMTRFVAPEMNAAMQMGYIVPVIAETALMVWLLVFAAHRVARG